MTLETFLAADDWLNAGTGPRYVRLRHRLEEAIETGLLGPNSPLPPERLIALQTGLSRVTVRRALADLANDAVIASKQGSGSFVCDPGQTARDVKSSARLLSFTEMAERRGQIPGAEVLDALTTEPSATETALFGLAPGDNVLRLIRVRTADTAPVALQHAVLPASLIRKPKKLKGSLFRALSAEGHAPDRMLDTITAGPVEKKPGKLLGLSKGATAIFIDRTTYNEAGRAVAQTRSTLRPEALDLLVEHRHIWDMDP